MDYAENYEPCMKENVTFLQQLMINKLSHKAESLGQKSHKIWSLKYLMDHYFQGRDELKIMDCGAWDGWFLSYDIPAIQQKIALDFDPHFGAEFAEKGIDFALTDMEKGHFPIASNTLDLVAMTSTLEHLSNPEHIATEIRRVLKPGALPSSPSRISRNTNSISGTTSPTNAPSRLSLLVFYSRRTRWRLLNSPPTTTISLSPETYSQNRSTNS